MPNTSFTRPTGILCSGTAYNNKKNPYEKLKEFLFEENTGRTDVVFFASAATGYEADQWTYQYTGQDDYSYVGGFIDGFSKALLKGDVGSNRPARKLYGTPVKLGYEAHTIPNFDAWDNTTWFNPNNTGLGNYLVGTATAYGSYYYYKHNTNPPTPSNSNTGLHLVSLPNPGTNTFYQFHPDVGETSLTWPKLWFSALNNGLDFDNASPPSLSASIESKRNWTFAASIQLSAEPDSNRTNLTSTTVPWTPRVTQTPEQPQRFWHIDHPWFIPNATTSKIPIGIGYLDSTNNKVLELFTDAVNYGYTTGLGLSVGTDISVIQANPNLSLVKFNPLTGNWEPGTGYSTVLNYLMWGGREQSILGENAWNDLYDSELKNKQIIVRNLSFAEIITIRGLTIKPTPPTSLAEFKQYDGFQVSGTGLNGPVFMRWPWTNVDTLATPNTTFANNKLFKKWGLATLTDETVSNKQAGLPYIWMWGIRSCLSSMGSWQLFDYGTPRVIPISSYPLDTQLLGFPRSLSTVAPAGFFMLTQEDTPKMIAANTTIDKTRCLTIKPDLGYFHDGFNPEGTIPLNNLLGPAVKENILGIFKSPNFKYCVTAYTLDKFSDESTFEGANIVVTGHYKPLGGSTLTQIQAATNVVLPQTTRNKANGDSRLFTRTLVETTFNLNTVNGDWSVGEFRFGFLGYGSATNTKGNLMVTTHYGVDPNATHGISFSHGDLNFRYRSGDTAYQNKISGSTYGRHSVWLEMFKSIAERQTSASLGGTPGISKKLVLMFEVGVWETANPNVSYNGFNTWIYFLDPPSGPQSTGTTGRAYLSYEDKALAYILNAALLAGFTREEIVVAFYTPTAITRTNVHSEGTLDGLTFVTLADDNAFIENLNQRGNFIRAAEIFKNNILPGSGYFNPTPVGTSTFSSSNPAAQRALHIGMGSIASIAGKLNSVDNTTKDQWYPKQSLAGNPVCFTYSANGSLAVGKLLADYLNTQVSTTIYVPKWIKDFADILGETTDPVLGIDFSLLVDGSSITDIGPYLTDLKDLASAGNNLCREYISAYKHKTLQ